MSHVDENSAQKKGALLKRGDYLVLLACVIAIPLLFSRYGVVGSEGTQARINAGAREFALVSLQKNQTYHVPGPLGDSEIEVRDGRIRFVRSPCAGQQCVHSGWAHRGGEFIACVPNRVSLVVLGQGAGGTYYDSINF